MRISLHDYPGGIDVGNGLHAVYDVSMNAAAFGAARIAGRALVWELHDGPAPAGAKLSAEVALDPSTEWIVRCDRVDFPPGGVALLHTHPGPGVRCLLHGSIRIETDGRSTEYGPFGAWFESGPEPVFAEASRTEETAFVRVLLLPREWEGQRTISYVNAADADKPKTQRATVFFDLPLVA